MYKTGLRISDVLELKHDCVIMLDNNYWFETNILKASRLPFLHFLIKSFSVKNPSPPLMVYLPYVRF